LSDSGFYVRVYNTIIVVGSENDILLSSVPEPPDSTCVIRVRNLRIIIIIIYYYYRVLTQLCKRPRKILDIMLYYILCTRLGNCGPIFHRKMEYLKLHGQRVQCDYSCGSDLSDQFLRITAFAPFFIQSPN